MNYFTSIEFGKCFNKLKLGARKFTFNIASRPIVLGLVYQSINYIKLTGEESYVKLISVQFSSVILALSFLISPLAHAAGGKGLTWAKQGHNYAGANPGGIANTYGVDRIGCQVPPAGAGDCNPHLGDTSCALSRPILCLKVDGSTNPYSTNAAAWAKDPTTKNNWAKGHIATTMPIQGSALSTATTGDAICNATFGTDWRMATHHDNNGLGWVLWAYGNVRNDQRFWVKVNGALGNCWNP